MIWAIMISIWVMTPSAIFHKTRITNSSSQGLSLLRVIPVPFPFRPSSCFPPCRFSVLALVDIKHKKACSIRRSMTWSMCPNRIRKAWGTWSQASGMHRGINCWTYQLRYSLMNLISTQMKPVQKKRVKRQLRSKSWWAHWRLGQWIPLWKKQKNQ